mmetsp:Transcript_26152/g.66449  ORF Transcript_26152/g.66449 Transcript_26152/m.66449 type:complete len:134 (-) Transcript_26152:1736-2137(-)
MCFRCNVTIHKLMPVPTAFTLCAQFDRTTVLPLRSITILYRQFFSSFSSLLAFRLLLCFCFFLSPFFFLTRDTSYYFSTYLYRICKCASTSAVQKHSCGAALVILPVHHFTLHPSQLNTPLALSAILTDVVSD